jgi:hypothetical protein
VEKMSEEYGHIPDGFFLSEKEIEELRKSKKELTEYGKQRLKELAKEGISKYNEALQLMRNQEPYPDEFFEEAERREVANRELEKEEWERKVRSNRILERYNQFYNTECSGLSHGTPITPEFQQAMTLECMLDALRYENLNHEFSEVSTDDINALIEGLYQQGGDYLERVRKLKGEEE